MQKNSKKCQKLPKNTKNVHKEAKYRKNVLELPKYKKISESQENTDHKVQKSKRNSKKKT